MSRQLLTKGIKLEGPDVEHRQKIDRVCLLMFGGEVSLDGSADWPCPDCKRCAEILYPCNLRICIMCCGEHSARSCNVTMKPPFCGSWRALDKQGLFLEFAISRSESRFSLHTIDSNT